jgi:nucleoside-diphosphate-sugar epimerase
MPVGSGMLLLTGGTGLVGSQLLRRHLALRPDLHFVILTRRPDQAAASWGERVRVVRGDIRRTDLGLTAGAARELRAGLTGILHCAVDSRFGRPLEEARATNTRGTANVLALARRCPRLEKFAHLSTAYVAGRSTGRLAETPCRHDCDFVNTYQQSKYEAEQLVLGALGQIPVAVFRLSTIIGDSATGRVRQFNYFHHFMKLFPHVGVLPVFPGDPAAPIDLVPTNWAIAALAHLFEHHFLPGRVYQVCAGPEASLTTQQLMEQTLEVFATHPAGLRWQPIRLPRLVSLAAYEEYVARTWAKSDALSRELLRVVGQFVPHLALYQAFDNHNTLEGTRACGLELPSMRTCFERVLRYCLDTNWGRRPRLSLAGPAPIIAAPPRARLTDSLQGRTDPCEG